MRPNHTLAVLLAITFAGSAHAQGVGINATGAAADTSAILDLSATNKGFLPPRMKQSQRLEIVQPATGLLVYQTDGAAGLWYNAGSSVAPNWKQVVDAASVAPQPWFVNGSSLYCAPGYVGIGTSTPNAPLSFPPTFGKKLSLYPGTNGDVGLGVASNRLQIFADHSGADVAVGWDEAGSFQERFAFKPNGALAVGGDVGAAGQVLQSNGAGAGAAWVNPTHAAFDGIYTAQGTGAFVAPSTGGFFPIPGTSVGFTTEGNARVLVDASLMVSGVFVPTSGLSSVEVQALVDGAPAYACFESVRSSEYRTLVAKFTVTVPAGAHTVSLQAAAYPAAIRLGEPAPYQNRLTVQVVPE